MVQVRLLSNEPLEFASTTDLDSQAAVWVAQHLEDARELVLVLDGTPWQTMGTRISSSTTLAQTAIQHCFTKAASNTQYEVICVAPEGFVDINAWLLLVTDGTDAYLTIVVRSASPIVSLVA